MDGFSGAATVIGLVSAGATTIQRVAEFIKDIRKAPEEMLGLGRQLELVNRSLSGVEDLVSQSDSSTERNGSLDRIIATVEYCIEILNSIEVLIDEGKGTRSPQNRIRKVATSAKFVKNKKKIHELQIQLDHVMGSLNIEISVNLSHQNMKIQDLVTNLSRDLVIDHKVSLVVDMNQTASIGSLVAGKKSPSLLHLNQSAPSGAPMTDKKLPLLLESGQSAPCGTLVAEENCKLLANSSQSSSCSSLSNSENSSLLIGSSNSAVQAKSLDLLSRHFSQTVSKERALTWYNGILGSVTVRKKSRFAGDTREVNAGPTTEETTIFLRPSFLRKYYELQISQSFGRISRTLNVD